MGLFKVVIAPDAMPWVAAGLDEMEQHLVRCIHEAEKFLLDVEVLKVDLQRVQAWRNYFHGLESRGQGDLELDLVFEDALLLKAALVLDAGRQHELQQRFEEAVPSPPLSLIDQFHSRRVRRMLAASRFLVDAFNDAERLLGNWGLRFDFDEIRSDSLPSRL